MKQSRLTKCIHCAYYLQRQQFVFKLETSSKGLNKFASEIFKPPKSLTYLCLHAFDIVAESIYLKGVKKLFIICIILCLIKKIFKKIFSMPQKNNKYFKNNISSMLLATNTAFPIDFHWMHFY